LAPDSLSVLYYSWKGAGGKEKEGNGKCEQEEGRRMVRKRSEGHTCPPFGL